MYDQDPLVSGTIRRRVDAFTGSDHYRFTIDGIGYDGHWAHDTRRLLDENARLNTEMAARDRTVEALSARLAAKNAELDKTIQGMLNAGAEWASKMESIRAERDEALREAAADKAKLAAENARYLQIISGITAHNAGLNSCLDAVIDVITPKNPGWVPLTERYPEHFEPDSPEEVARKKGWGQGVDLLTQRIKGALEKAPAAPEMPRPPAEEAQERPETAETGSGRGTGVAEASGTAEPSIAWRGDACEHKPEWRCSAHGECRGCECACFTYLPSLPAPGEEA